MRRSCSSRLGEAVVGDRLDAAGLEEVLGEGRARGEIGDARRDWRERSSAARRSSPACGRTHRAAPRTVRRAAAAAAASNLIDCGIGRQRRPAAHRAPATGASARSGNSLVPVSASLRRATAASRSARTAATLLLDQAGLERGRRRRRPARSPGTAPRPRGKAVAVRSSIAAGAGGRIGHLREVRFLEQQKLGVARERGAQSGRAGRAPG